MEATRMAAEARYVVWLGLEVKDPAGYARYREEMAPILAAHGGRFEHDFEVAKVLKSSASPRINRVFAMSFPNEDLRKRFLADAQYQRVRAAWFAPSVASSEQLSAGEGS